MQVGKKHNIFKLVAIRSESAVIQQALESLPMVTFDTTASANIEIHAKRDTKNLPYFKMDEDYKLQVTSKKIIIHAKNEYGVVHALNTLKQLHTHYKENLPELTIEDRPRFPWRGLLIDVARNWMDLETLKKQIELMSVVKLNILHLHLSDDQAFRVESKRYPKLHKKNHEKKFYTQDEIKELVTFAGLKGIRVVPEFDVPGHTSSILAAYPELASQKGSSKPSIKFGPHDEAMNPILDETYLFLENLFTEMSGLFPDVFFHVGGDEVSGKHWLANPSIVSYMKEKNIKDTTELQFQFTKRIEGLVEKLGKKMMAWDEVLKEKEQLKSIAQIWRGPKFGKQALALKMPVVYSYGYYLDLQLSTEGHYLQDPSADMGLKQDPQLLWGGEACMWSERMPAIFATHRIWPKAMAVAERLWSSREQRDTQKFYLRARNLSQSLNITNNLLSDKIKKESSKYNLPPEALTVLLTWLEPGKFYSQHRYRTIDTETEWDQWVDYISPESYKATNLKWYWEKWLKTKKAEDLVPLEAVFNGLVQLSGNLSTLKGSDDLVSLNKDLGSLGKIAIDTLNYLKNNEKPGYQWFMENRTKLGMMGQVRAGMQPAPHAVVEKMVYHLADKYSLPSR